MFIRSGVWLGYYVNVNLKVFQVQKFIMFAGDIKTIDDDDYDEPTGELVLDRLKRYHLFSNELSFYPHNNSSVKDKRSDTTLPEHSQKSSIL